MPVILAIDQGTTGTTVLAVDQRGGVVGRAYREIEQHYPQPGWVEHDPEEIWRSVQETVDAALKAGGLAPGWSTGRILLWGAAIGAGLLAWRHFSEDR